MTFAQKLVTLRRQAGYSQEQLAEKMNVSRQAVSKWEIGDTLPDTAKVIQLSRLFDVTIDYLLKEEAEKASPEPCCMPEAETVSPSQVVSPFQVVSPPPVSEPELAPQQTEPPKRKDLPKWIAGWILTGLGGLGYLVIWVLSTMIVSYEDYSYMDAEGVIWYSIRDGYSWEGFISRYRLEAVLWILGIMLLAGLLLLLWAKTGSMDETES